MTIDDALDGTVLAEFDLVADVDADAELGSQGGDLGSTGGFFHQAFGLRTQWAQVALRLGADEPIRFILVAPSTVREDQPVTFTWESGGRIGLTYAPVEASVEQRRGGGCVIYHCAVQGSGDGSTLARWDLVENPTRADGVQREIDLVCTIPVQGELSGDLSVSARVVRSGVGGMIDALRDLVARAPTRRIPIRLQVPKATG